MQNTQKLSFFSKSVLILGYLFLYAPMIAVMVYSFNSSRLVTVWDQFSTKWYYELAKDDVMITAAWISLRVAVVSSTIAIVIGGMAGFVLARFGRFRGHSVFSSMITAPLVMPEVITALSLLLFFVSIQNLAAALDGMIILGFVFEAPIWLKQKGMVHIIIAHATFSAAYVAVVISSRMRELDISIEEAAQDLGATPFKVFLTITVPIIMPAIISGWIMGFSMSLDDIVISAFVTGPGTTTLPIVVYSQVKLGVSPKINALATIIIVLVTVCVVTSAIIMSRVEKRRNKELQKAAAFTGGIVQTVA
jgi:putrescine transport system permease protein